MEKSLRDSGIDVIGNVPWGTHFCQFYQTKEDLIEILIPYFRAGLENNELCIWITTGSLNVEEAKRALRMAIFNFDAYLRKAQIEIISYADLGLKNEVFNSQKILDYWTGKLSQALTSGYEGLRLSEDTFWLRKNIWKDFVDYEKEMIQVTGSYQIIALCTYSLNENNPTKILDIAANHQFTLIKEEGKWKQIENSQHKLMETTLKRNEQHLNDILSNIHGILELDKNWRITYINENAAHNIGFEPEKLIGECVWEKFPYRVGSKLETMFIEVMETRLPAHIEIKSLIRDQWFDIGVYPSSAGILVLLKDITENKQAEQNLRESETSLHKLYESGMIGVFYYALDGSITDANDIFLEMVGYTREDLKAGEINWSRITPQIYHAQDKRGIKELKATGMKKPCEREYIRKDGSHIPIIIGAAKIDEEKGIAFVLDITERKEVEKALKEAYQGLEEKIKERTAELEEAYNSLKESEESLSEAQRMAHIGNWDWNLVTGEVHWSEELYRIFGRNPQESGATYDELLNYIHPKDREYVDNVIKKRLEGGRRGVDYRIITASGGEHTVHAESAIIFNLNKIPIRVKGIVQDITERKEAEEKIQSLANIVESSNDAIITESLDGIITSWNKGAEQVYSYSAEEILGKQISILEPGILFEETKRLADLVKQGEKIQQYETLRLKKDGTIINVSITLSPVFNVAGKLTAISVIYRDITKRKKAENALASIGIARQKEIHHRIKNNLQVISSLLDLQADKFDDPEVIEAFRESQNRVISMALIHEELYKGEETDTLDFSTYIRELSEKLFQTYRLGNANTSLKIDLEENIFFDMDVSVPLGMIVNELLSNSFKYAFQGRKRGEIQIKLYRQENTGCGNTEYVLIVSDDGVGIPEKMDIENPDTLGLQLVNALVDQLDGTIEIKRDKGTKFIIKLQTNKKFGNKR